jgi:hypothetical protein
LGVLVRGKYAEQLKANSNVVVPYPEIAEFVSRRGWRQTMIKGGEELTVNGFLSKDGANLLWALSVDFADGRKSMMTFT